jgi:hypothetical protein
MSERGPVSRLRHLLNALRSAGATGTRPARTNGKCSPRIRLVDFCDRHGRTTKEPDSEA